MLLFLIKHKRIMKVQQLNKYQQFRINKMNKKQQQLFIAFFEEIYEAQEAFQFIKKKMARCLGYNPSLLFDILSARGDAITIHQMRAYLQDRVACNDRELYEIFQRMDWSRNGSISRDDFIREITPFGEPSPPVGTSGTVTAQIEGHFLSLLTEYVKRFRIVEVSRKQVDFIAPFNAFDQIDYARSGLVGLGELERFFNVNDFSLTDIQLQFLLHGLRRRCYLEVNLEVFCENLNPLEFGRYEAYQKEVDSAEETEFLKRSRREQQSMRRSRIESQKIEHSIAKQERRKRAELERELELEERINKQIREHEENKERHVRRAMLEQDKNIRWNVQTGNRVLEEERIKNLVESQRNRELGMVREQQNEINTVLARSALKREEDLEASRRARIYEREIQMRQQLERESEMRKRQWASEVEVQRRHYEDELRAERERERASQMEYEAERRRREEAHLDRSRYEEQMRLERERAQRQYQLNRIRDIDYSGSRSRVPEPSQSRRIAELERELEKTRYEMRERQSRLDQSNKRAIPETADRSFRN